MTTQPRLKSALMWVSMIATGVMGYIAINGTAAIGGNQLVDNAIIWVCGILALIGQFNNPTNRTDI